MDPFSTTTGVIALLGTCYTVGIELKKFYDDVGSVNKTVTGLRDDVDALTKVLNTMSASFESVSKPTAGHIGTHWENIDWNTVSIQGANKRILPSLEGIQRDIHGLATRLNGRISSL